MLYLQNGTITSSPRVHCRHGRDCSSSSTAAICQYADSMAMLDHIGGGMGRAQPETRSR